MTGTTFNRLTTWLAAAALSAASLAAAGQQSTVVVDDDEITIRGCVGRAQPGDATAGSTLVWTRGDIMLSNASATLAGTERVFYWLDDDEDLAKYVGRMIEVKGDVGDFEKGEVEIDKDGDFTEIELRLGGKTEKARVPSAWVGAPRSEGEFDIIARKVDVDKVTVLGNCPLR